MPAGRPRTFNTPDKFKAGIDDYFVQCEEQAVFPDLAGMRVYMNLRKRDIEEMTADGAEYAEEIRELLDYAMDKRESWLARKMASDNKAANGCYNHLKQPINGGYIDRPQKDTAEKKLKIIMTGVGENAFK